MPRKKNPQRIIGAVTTYLGDEHRYLKNCKVRIVAILKNADEDDGDYIDDEESLQKFCGGIESITAADRIEVEPWIEKEGRFSFVTSDPKASDLELFKHLRKS